MEENVVPPMPQNLPPGREKRGLGRTLLLVFVTALGMKFFLFDFMIAEGRSMLPAIRPGTVLLVNRVAYGFKPPWAGRYLVRWSRPAVGDVVVFHTPRGNIAVKRCGEVTENQEILALGDNDLESFDSRSYGPIPVDNILGRVMAVKR
ncbi:MAG: S26 family signal peptidase [Spirochaetaceae bacterium]|jgi:signal peptidase I|nr:S26 family signal peptidase [Spirochaetaceae bacterium]